MPKRDILMYGIGTEGLAELPVPPDAATVHDALMGFPAGVYSTVRTFGGNRFLGLAAHVDRLEASMRGIGIEEPLDRELLLRALDEVAARSGEAFGGDSVIRFDALSTAVPVGAGAGTLLLAAAPMEPVPLAARRDGVRVETTHLLRRDVPLVKTTAFVTERRCAPAATADCFERILLDDEDRLLEGSSSTFFAITKSEEIVTAADGVLEGVTRRILLQRAVALEIPVCFERLPLARVPEIAGALLSSSSRGVVPIVRIDDVTIGDGSVHPIAKRLAADYDAWALETARSALDVMRSSAPD